LILNSVLHYGLEICPVIRDQIRSLDTAVHSRFRKKISTTDQSVVEQCTAGHNERDKKEIRTQISNVTKSIVCYI